MLFIPLSFFQLPGNKMDAHNLATLFGPNVLHKSKGGDFQVETLERAEERKEVIAVIKDMIENYKVIYEVTRFTAIVKK